MKKVIKNRNFVWLWLGEAISVLGDQFFMIAMPWLVLQLTGSPLATGTVLAVAGIPRAIFMLVGGAITDRFSPVAVMRYSNFLRMLLVAVLAVIVYLGIIELWHLYLFALIFGLVDAFFFPAATAAVPLLVEKENLQPANSLVMGTMQLSVMLGPILAGTLIALFGGASNTGDEASVGMTGISLAFAIDALTFLVSIITLNMIRSPQAKSSDLTGQDDEESLTILGQIREGMVYVWQNELWRTIFILSASINLLIIGPILVGIPVLADFRLPEGASAYGIIMSAFGAGGLIGTILAGALPRIPPKYFGFSIMFSTASMAVGIILLAFTYDTMTAAAITLIMSIATGYVNVLALSWLQERLPEKLLGRVMSLLMFASVGLSPISMAVSGALIEWSLTGLMAGSGLFLLFVILYFIRNPQIRAMGLTPRLE